MTFDYSVQNLESCCIICFTLDRMSSFICKFLSGFCVKKCSSWLTVLHSGLTLYCVSAQRIEMCNSFEQKTLPDLLVQTSSNLRCCCSEISRCKAETASRTSSSRGRAGRCSGFQLLLIFRLNFAGRLWDALEIVYNKSRDSKHTARSMAAFFAELSSIEEKYAQSIIKLTTAGEYQGFLSKEGSTLGACWATVCKEAAHRQFPARTVAN